MGSSDLLSNATLAVGATIARIATAFAADLSFGLSNGVTIAIARGTLAVKATGAGVRENLIHVRGLLRL